MTVDTLKNAPAVAEQISFVEAEAQKLRKYAHARQDAAASWRGGTNESHEAARKWGEAMGGRKLARTTRKEREEIAAREERIALKHDADVRMYEAIAENLRRLL